MTKRCGLRLVLGVGLMLPALAVAQPAGDQTQSAPVVAADEQPTAQQLGRLFEVMRVKEQMASTTRMMPQLLQQQFTQQLEQMQKDHPELAKLTPEQQQESAKVMKKFMAEAMAVYTPEEMMADMQAIYQKHLTGSDVENIITFYSSPSGQHMLDMVPVIMQEFMPAAMGKMQAKMRPLIVEMSKELAAIAQSSAPAQEKPEQR